MTGATFRNCNLTWADLSYAEGKDVTLDRVTAINLNAPGLTLDHSTIINSNMSGAYMSGLKAGQSNIDRSNFTSANMQRAHLVESHMDESNLERTDLTNANVTDATVTNDNMDAQTKLARVRAKGTNFSGSKLASEVTDGLTTDKNTKVTDADVANLNVDGHSIGEVDTSDAIASDVKHQIPLNQAQKEIDDNRRKFYNKVGIGILVGACFLSIAFPPLLGAVLPATLAAVAMPTIINVTMIGAMVVGIPTAVELAVRNFTPPAVADAAAGLINTIQNGINWVYGKETKAKPSAYDGPSIIRPIANLFGAKKYLKWKNAKHEEKREKEEAKLGARQEEAEHVQDRERAIAANANARHAQQKQEKEQAATQVRTERARTEVGEHDLRPGEIRHDTHNPIHKKAAAKTGKDTAEKQKTK